MPVVARKAWSSLRLWVMLKTWTARAQKTVRQRDAADAFYAERMRDDMRVMLTSWHEHWHAKGRK